MAAVGRATTGPIAPAAHDAMGQVSADPATSVGIGTGCGCTAQQDEAGAHEQLVGHRVEERAELRLNMPEAVDGCFGGARARLSGTRWVRNTVTSGVPVSRLASQSARSR